MEFFWFSGGAVLGVLIGWMLGKVKLAAVEARARLLEETTARLQDTFKALAGEALRSNNESFLRLAEQTLKTVTTQAAGDLELRKQAVDELVKPLGEALKHVESQRQQAYGELNALLKTLSQTQDQLRRETGSLATALKSPQVRGRWGEMTLRRVVELAGLVERCDFTEQQTVTTGEGMLRPDMVVHLPGEAEVVVDSKAVLSAYLDAMEATTEESRQTFLRQHAQHLRERVRQLAGKKYWEQFLRSPEFVVLFIPGESFLSAALSFDPTLIEDAMASRIVLATPTTLVALLKAVAYGWRQQQVAENAERIGELGKELYERLLAWVDHLRRMRDALEEAVESFNRAASSLEGRVLVSARRMKELGLSSDKAATPVEPIPVSPRALSKND